MLDVAKHTVKRLALRSGALSFLQALTRRDTLTVLMFHRVLPPSDPRFAYAAPTFTLRLDTFKACMTFCRSSYSIVSLDQVRAAIGGDSPLPPNALLVTFDDGWEDTARYAVPVLQELSIPAVVFVSSGAVGASHLPWRDVADCLWRARGAISWNGVRHETWSRREFLEYLKGLTPSERNEWLSLAVTQAGARVEPCIMSQADLIELDRKGIAIGGHGVTHESLTDCDEVDSEIVPCMAQLTTMLGYKPAAFSFPNGRYTPDIAQRVLACGFELVFTSDAWSNRLVGGRPVGHQFGRVCPSEDDISDAAGVFSPEKLALLLLQLPIGGEPAR